MLGSVERMAQKSAAIDPMIAEVAIASTKAARRGAEKRRAASHRRPTGAKLPA